MAGERKLDLRLSDPLQPCETTATQEASIYVDIGSSRLRAITSIRVGQLIHVPGVKSCEQSPHSVGVTVTFDAEAMDESAILEGAAQLGFIKG